MRTRRKIPLILAAIAVAIIVPAAAMAAPAQFLKNDYGLTFAGQTECLSCHGVKYSQTAHSRFAAATALPADSYYWPVMAPNGLGMKIEATDVAFTVGDIAGGSLTEYLLFSPTPGSPQTNPFRVVEGLEWSSAEGKWELPLDGTGLYTGAYCGSRCHMVGAQKPGTGKTIPNTNITTQPTPTTPDAWARYQGSDLETLSTYVPGSSIQCELCHGTGVAAAVDAGGHWNSGVKVVGYGTNPYSKVGSNKVLDSQICGACHVTSSNATGTLGTVGFTPDQRLADFISVASTIPAEADFEADPAIRSGARFYPNGANKAMHHSYYNEWAVSAHSYRGQLTSSSVDALPFQKAGHGHYNPTTNTSLACAKCHTGEGYLYRKNAPIMQGYTLATATAGFYGQECAVCHYSHEPDGSGLGVREPDTAGVGSAAGLSTANSSMCEDCHNWQQEVQGTTFSATSGRVSHPQREVLHGRGMPDVPVMPEFMPGAKCEECHMPVTHETRKSHRFMIVTPGDAVAWGVVNDATLEDGNNGDSCSKCHAGETLEELQANLDLWQSQTQAAWDEATAALAAAVSRPASRTTTLDERAKTLISFSTADGSLGAHNPPYVAAGLAKAKLFARAVGASFIEYSVSEPIYADGPGGFVSAKLVDGASAPIADQSVDLLTGTTLLATVKTGSDGKVTFHVQPTVTTSYHMTWTARSGSAVDSGVKTITVNKRPTYSFTQLNRTSMYYGSSVKVSGGVIPAPPGAVVAVQRKYGSGSWYTISTRALSTSGTYAFYNKPTRRGYWYYRTVYGGNALYARSTSSAKRVYVR